MKPDQSRQKWAAVIGDPVAHSLSPLLHQTWLRELRREGAYRRVLVRAEDFSKTMNQFFADPLFCGVNITLPHKLAALEFADICTQTARHVGAANVLVRKNSKFLADNTDVAGFLHPLQSFQTNTNFQKETALVFGAGGAARAVLVALHQTGYQRILLCNRNSQKAQNLIAELKALPLEYLDWQDRNSPKTRPDLVVNASSAGMTGFDPLDVNLGFCHDETLVYDLVYQPLRTPFLTQAKIKNLRTIGGLEMLVGQARPSFEMFFGVKPPDSAAAKDKLLSVLQSRENQDK
jgi:shikimate dehydrogenase